MSTKSALIILAVLLVVMAATGALAFDRLPERVASHWNEKGEADGYSSRWMGLAFTPLLALVTSLFILGIPYIDPLKRNIATFRRDYNVFVVIFAGFLAWLHLLTLAFNLGCKFNLLQLLIPAFAGIFFFTGVLLGKAKRNFFIGIRTPWTLASEEVWQQTHKRGSLLFKAAAVFSLLGVVFPAQAIYLLMVPILGVALYTVVYSYWLYSRTEHKTPPEF